MSTKIFPWRKYNSTKGRIDVPNVPSRQPSMTEEDRIVMRELIKEAALLELERRIKALLPKPLSIVTPQISIIHYRPEYIFAFKSLSRLDKRVLIRKREYKHMLEAIEWLDAFQTGVESYCAACGFNITAYQPDLVPYEVIVIERSPLIIEGLCKDCSELEIKNKELKIITYLNLHLKG